MKRIIKITLLACLMGILANPIIAQSKLKVGHINSAELLQMMPGKDSAQKILIDYANSLEQQLTIMSQEFETKYQDYLANESKMTQILKNSKQKELTDLQNRIIEFQEQAQLELQAKESELVSPLLQKAQDAIKDVAKENGYTYILDTSSGSILYFPETDDIMNLVKVKLMIN